MRLIVGDIHGCYDEFVELLEAAGINKQDEIIAVGDILDRGPKPNEVLDFFLNRPNTRTIMGNHERKHIRAFEGRGRAALSQRITRLTLGEEKYCEAYSFMKTLPLFLELEEALIIHGFWEPGLSVKQQNEKVLAGYMSAEAELERKLPSVWYELYDGEKPLIMGHHNYMKGTPLVIEGRVYGVDTGACFGGSLTGLLLPEFKYVSVPSKRNYWKETKRQHPHLQFECTPDKKLTWDVLDEFVNMTGLPATMQPRQERLKKMHDEGQAALARIVKRVNSDFKALGDCVEDGSRFAEKIMDSPLTGFLHQRRKGRFDPKSVKDSFKRPADLVDFCRKHGI